jgi:hypothetical protein
MNARGIVEFEFHSFFTSTIDGVNGQIHALAALPSGKNVPGFY